MILRGLFAGKFEVTATLVELSRMSTRWDRGMARGSITSQLDISSHATPAGEYAYFKIESTASRF